MTMHDQRGTARWDRALRVLIWGGAALLLLLPLVAMQFTAEVNWDGFDFAVMGALLLAVCSACELALRRSGDWFYRAGFAGAVGTGFLLIWANLAVGYIGDEGNPWNLLFAGVLAVALLGAIMARFRPAGMARAMAATAAAHGLAAAGALAGRMDVPLAPTVIFVILWLASAALFHQAARSPSLGRA